MGKCQGLACQIDACVGQSPTTIVGRVLSPSGQHPVDSALVFVPSSVTDFPDTVTCESCDEPAGGVPLVVTTSKVDGTFSLPGVPTGTGITLIIQKGRFRKHLTVDLVACGSKDTGDVRLPANQGEGDMPKLAVGVGAYDQIECVLRSIGIADGEFTAPDGSGSVHLYNNGEGANPPYPEMEALLGDLDAMKKYNVIFLNCTDHRWQQLTNKAGIATNLEAYANAGGRLYVTDLAYDYVEQVPQFSPLIYFNGGGSMTMPQPIGVAVGGFDTDDFSASVVDPTLQSWLVAAGETSGDTLTVTDLSPGWALIDSVDTDHATTWVHGNTNGADRPLTVTFDYNACGRVLYSSYHTRQPGGSDLYQGEPFPGYCQSGPKTMIAQEKILEYLILHISSCLSPIG